MVKVSVFACRGARKASNMLNREEEQIFLTTGVLERFEAHIALLPCVFFLLFLSWYS